MTDRTLNSASSNRTQPLHPIAPTNPSSPPLHPHYPLHSPGRTSVWTWAGTGALVSEARESLPPFPRRSHSRVMCFFSLPVSAGRPRAGPALWASEAAWSLGLRDRQLLSRWETAASQLSSQPWRGQVEGEERERRTGGKKRSG